MKSLGLNLIEGIKENPKEGHQKEEVSNKPNVSKEPHVEE